jgi:negative regulator of replication initiation
MKTIRISDDVWNAMAEYGKFGETPDDVLRRVLKISPNTIRISEKKRRPGKMAFIDTHLTATGGSRKTKTEIAQLYRKEFPNVSEMTARNSVAFCASTIRNRIGKESNHLP